MERGRERRTHPRLPLRLTVVCQAVGVPEGTVYRGNTVNVSPGGMLMEINSRQVKKGQLLSIDMTVPPDEELFDFGGRFSSYARVMRVEDLSCGTRPRSGSAVQTVALEFCQSPKLRA